MNGALTAWLAVVAAASLHGEEESAFQFQYDLAPHLARAGCAAADCHGGATGRGGFKLSLFATNARADYEAITQDFGGRRVDYAEPAQSLLLRKPTRQMKHKGGRVLDRDGKAYLALEHWIRSGAPFATGHAETLTALTMDQRENRVFVTAEFKAASGKTRQRDVTDLSRLESLNDRVVSIDERGEFALHEPGKTWLLAHYGPLSARVPIRIPFAAPGDPADTPHPLDEAWYSCLAQIGLRPAPPVDDHQLLRRLYIDLCGRPPAPHEIRAFQNLPEPERVEATVGKLLDSAECADQLSRRLGAWFEVPSTQEDLHYTSERNVRLRSLTRGFAASDRSLLDFAVSLFREPGRREFVNRFGDPRDRAEFAGRALLGISIGCARCHNHPADRWTQAQHLRFSAYFTDQRPLAGRDGLMTPGKFFLPGDGKAVEPALLPLGGARPHADDEGDRAAQLARFLREDAAGALARNAANRVFGMLIGRHLVESPDDHRPGNPALHEPLMDLLATEFEKEGFRLRPLIRLIVTSRLYAASGDPPRADTLTGDPQRHYLARREARPMTGDDFLRSVEFVLGVSTPPVERPDTPLAQQLQLLNSGFLQESLRAPGNQVDALFEFETDARKQLDALYLLILTRPPRPEERAEFLPLLEASDDRRATGRELAFALFASREFSSIR